MFGPVTSGTTVGLSYLNSAVGEVPWPQESFFVDICKTRSHGLLRLPQRVMAAGDPALAVGGTARSNWGEEGDLRDAALGAGV
jgi:hypothetical protein